MIHIAHGNQRFNKLPLFFWNQDTLRTSLSAITDVLNTNQNKDHDNELDLIAIQDDQEVKHKSFIEYIELEGIQEHRPRI